MELGKAIELAKRLLTNNKLRGWKVCISDDRVNPGYCDYVTKTISLSGRYIPHCTYRGVYNLIVHEIAHALCPGNGHGPMWKRKCMMFGGDGKVEFDPTESLIDVTLLAEIL